MIETYYELLLTIRLKKTIELKNMNEELSNAINFGFTIDEDLKAFHEKNKIKMYVFHGLYPIAKRYKERNKHYFSIRSFNKELLLKLGNSLGQKENKLFTIIGITFEETNFKPIRELKTLTPVVATIKDGRYWNKAEFNEKQLRKAIENNLLKKYSILNNKDRTEHNFIESFERTSKHDIVISYKNGKIIGHKIKIRFKEDILSQELAFIALGIGLGEKNSLGFGFCVKT